MKARILTLLLFVMLDVVGAYAQADRHEVRRGNRLFGKENWKEAELAYRKALVKDSLSVAGRYNLASALYRQENYEGAGELMSSFDGQEVSSDVNYNAGDVALQLKDYAGAVEAFKRSLLLNPGDLDAKENYIYAKKMLENQQRQQQGGGQDSQDDNDNDGGGQQPQDQPQNQPQPRDDGGNDGDSGNGAAISPQQAQQMLNAVQASEQRTRDKVDREKAAMLKSRQKEKNW